MEGYHLLKSDNTNISREELEKEIERLKVELKSVRDELKNKSKLSTSVANISSNQNSINDELLIQFSENIREVFWLHDCVNDKTMFVSPSFNKIFGVSLDNYEDAANFWKDAIHEDDKDLMNESFKKLAEGSTSETIEYIFNRF